MTSTESPSTAPGDGLASAWSGFRPGLWNTAINVRDFIQANYDPYDGDGRFDTAVFRPSTADWFVQRSTAGILITNFGASGDRPIPNAFVP